MMKKKLVLAQLALLPWVCHPSRLHGQRITTTPMFTTSIDGIERNSPSPANSSADTEHNEHPASGEYVSSASAIVKKQFKVKPFSTIALSLRSNTLGPGVDIATPLSRSFNLRAGFSLMNFGYGFAIDGMDYESRIRLRAGQLSLDWFPRHGRFHISPGLMYERNNLSAITNVPAGKYFLLGSQGLINSVDDPVNGTASAAVPRKIAPMLTLGFGNMIPRTGRHLSFPVEFGAAYTGAPRINLTLDGTACTNEGCFTFSRNRDALTSLQQEIEKLNEKLKKFPVYPIFSSGVAIRF